MKRFLSSIKGESSSKGQQGPPQGASQGPEQQLQLWAKVKYIELPDDREYTEPIANAPHFPTSPPLPANCGETILWQEIFDGTLKFGQTYFLGRGSFGDVYRCDLPRTNQVGAVKIQNRDNPSGQSEFVAEVTTLHAASHPNVIRLLGKWYGRRNRAIVYEFMPNGSLDRHLFAHASQGQGPQGLLLPRRVLDWETRMRIAVGVAEGLVYLHQGLRAIHRDVKVENILLDESFVPKLTDFGFAAKIAINEDGFEMQREINTSGTRGYIAPEAEDFGLVSTKSDIYSYGVFLLVLFTGRKAYDLARPITTLKLTDWLMQVWTREEHASLVVDVKLGNKFSVEGLNRIIHTARMCIDAQALARPAMDFVETMVREAAAYQVPEQPPVTGESSSNAAKGPPQDPPVPPVMEQPQPQGPPMYRHNIIMGNLVAGLLSIAPFMCAVDKIGGQQRKIAALLFTISLVYSTTGNIINSFLGNRELLEASIDACVAGLFFCLGALVPFFSGIAIHKRKTRIVVMFSIVPVLIACVLVYDWWKKMRNNVPMPEWWKIAIFWVLISVASIGLPVYMNYLILHIFS